MLKLDLKKCEVIRLPAGTVYILHSDSHQSIGFLRLNPKSSYEKHNRPAVEWLVQVEGVSVVELYDAERIIDKVTLQRGDALRIPANQYHQHTNRQDTESLTSWHFDGDITPVIEQLRTLVPHPTDTVG